MNHLQETSYIIYIRGLNLTPKAAKKTIESRSETELELTLGGVVGDTHFGSERASCVRVKELHPRGTIIKNERQVTMVSKEELSDIAERLEMDHIDEGWLGANILVEGLPDLSHVPPGSRLQAPSGLTLVADLQNHPCSIVKKTIESATGGQGADFKKAAEGRRGITLCVERAGSIRIGDQLRLYVPTQRAWRG